MSQMLAETSRIVNEDISSRVNQYDVIFEALTNSIHANATHIKCYMNCLNQVANDGESDLAPIKLDTILITDNGDGLTDENYQSFSTYRSQHKKKLGCKGVGRFVFLKVYQSANYKSKIQSTQEERQFKFDFKFDTENIEVKKNNVHENETVVSFHTLTNQYLDYKKHIDRRITLDLETIKDKVLKHLLPTLFFYKEKGVEITIDFNR